MYDTVYDDISTSAMALVRSLLKKNVNVSIVPQVQKQDEMWIMVAIATSVTWFISWPI